MKTTIFLNQAEDNFYGYKQGAPLREVTTLDFPWATYDMQALEAAFQVGNGADPESESQYYVHGVRSISVGDVIVLDGERAYACEPCGWTPVEVPKVTTA